MWKYKKEYTNVLIFFKCYGNVDTSKIDANTIYQLSLQEQTKPLIRLIEKDEEPKKTSKKDESKKGSSK